MREFPWARLRNLSLAAPLFLFSAGAMAQDKVVNVYNWTDYTDPKVLEKFTAETGIKVRYDVYDSLETLEGKLLAGHSGYDVVVPTSEPTFDRLIKSGALMKLDKSQISNLAGLDPTLMKQVQTSDPGNNYGAIYLWGTIGLGIIPAKVRALDPDAPMDSWDLLFKPDHAKKLAKCGITMMDSAIDVIPSVLKYLGKSPDSTNAADLAAVEKTLAGIRPYIRTFASSAAVEALAAGDTCVVLSYSGDVIQAAARAQEAKRGVAVRYIAPKEGPQLWFDMMAVPADAPDAANAMAFINFMLRPTSMAAISNKVTYPNAVPASRPEISPEIVNNPGIYPPQAVLDNTFTVGPVADAATRARGRMWARFKAGH